MMRSKLFLTRRMLFYLEKNLQKKKEKINDIFLNKNINNKIFPSENNKKKYKIMNFIFLNLK